MNGPPKASDLSPDRLTEFASFVSYPVPAKYNRITFVKTTNEAKKRLAEHKNAHHKCQFCTFFPFNGCYGRHWKVLLDKHERTCIAKIEKCALAKCRVRAINLPCRQRFQGSRWGGAGRSPARNFFIFFHIFRIFLSDFQGEKG